MIIDMTYGIKENLFLYLAHPDYYLRDRPIWDDAAINIVHKICKLCSDYDLPLELNYNGIKRQKVEGKRIDYSYIEFYKIAASYGSDVCIGMDAHYPERLIEQEYFSDLYKIVDEFHLNLLTKEDLIKRIRK